MIKRETWVDTSKGVGIIAVVIGHTSNLLTPFLYWFHMPLFFIISGYLAKPADNWTEFKASIKRRTLQMLIPYLAFLIIYAALSRLSFGLFVKTGHVDFINFKPIDFILGGRELNGLFAVFWFITCFYATQVLFGIIVLIFKKTPAQIAALIALYVLAHLEATLFATHNFIVPWCLDVALFTSAFYAIGYYGKSFIGGKNYIILTAASVFSLLFLLAEINGLLTYQLDLKNVQYTNVLLDLLVPLSFSIVVFGLSKFIASHRKTSSLLNRLGQQSLTIMYLHIPVLWMSGFILKRLLPDSLAYIKLPITIILAAIIPLLIAQLLDKYSLTRYLLLGKIQFRTSKQIQPKVSV